MIGASERRNGTRRAARSARCLAAWARSVVIVTSLAALFGESWVWAATCVVCDADGTGVPGCHPRATDYAQVCVGSAFAEDRDCDGYPDDCDTDPDTQAPATPEAPRRPNSTDTDHDGAEIDNCPMHWNADQADEDGDGRGDVCDTCKRKSNVDQSDSDHDGVGDACDACPGDPNVGLAGPDHDEATCAVVVSSFRDQKDRERRANVVLLLRPSLSSYWPLGNVGGDAEVAAGAHGMLTGSIDAWKHLPNDFAEPPTWFWHVGAYADVTRFTDTPTRFGSIVGVDVRPMGTPGFANWWLKDFKLGLLLHYLTGKPQSDEQVKWVQRVGASLNLSFLDVVSVAPGFQTDLAYDNQTTLSVLALFDFKYLEDLGVGDVRRVLKTY